MSRLIGLLAIIIIPVLYFVGFQIFEKKKYTDDYPEIHKDLLDEHLGEWQVVHERVVEVVYDSPFSSDREYADNLRRYMHADKIPWYVPSITFTKWSIEYEDEFGNNYEYVIDNMIPIEENLIYMYMEKLEGDIQPLRVDGMRARVSDPYLYGGDIKPKDKVKNFLKIKELKGDVFNLSSLGLDTAFKGVPTYVNITYSYENVENENLTADEYVAYAEEQLRLLIEKIPYLNAKISIYTGCIVETREFAVIQGERKENDGNYLTHYMFMKLLEEEFPEFSELEGA